ncbi:MAG TPA: sugar phosphate isomerase/epimerase family protein [Rectinemataceae bacterium]|nr:sugar phosphate isomerase/epimerase family protein [Rectinemataceae bacterium]
MRIFYSELCLIGGGVEDNVDSLIENGAEHIELMLDGAGWNDFHLRMEELSSMLKTKKATYSVHVPVWDVNLTCENSLLRAAALESYKQTIAFASMLNAGHVVLHTGWCADAHFSKETARRRVREDLLALHEFNKDYGQLLLVENIGSNATSLFTERQFIDFLDDFPGDIGYLVDLGHAWINGWRIESLLPALGPRLYALHIHDNDGKKDKHAPVGEGTIDWKSVFAAAAKTGRNLNLVLEYNIGTDLGRLAEGKAFLESLFPAASSVREV